MVTVVFDKEFRRRFERIRDHETKERVITQLAKLKQHPTAGKPMRYGRQGTRELRIPPYRLSYSVDGETIWILALYHKDEQ